MSRNKKTYIGILIIITLVVTVFYFSYAFFTNLIEGKGKLNIVAGTLDYRIESDDLEDGKITVGAKMIKEVEVKLTSLNDVSSKYELYYILDGSNDYVRAGYDIDTKDSVLGTIDANGTKMITIIIRNDSDSSMTVEFGVAGGLINNELALTVGKSLNQVIDKYTAYNIGDEITLTDGSKWHVLENSSEFNGTVTLLSDYNLNSDGSYNTECGRDINSDYLCSTMVFDPDDTSTYDETDSNNIGYFIKNTYEPLVTSVLSEVTNVTLPTAYQIAAAENLIFDVSSSSAVTLSNSWLLTTLYWTKTAHTYNNDVWFIYSSAENIGIADATAAFVGVRPVITVPKSNIVDTMDSDAVLTIGDSVEAIDGSKWYVLEVSGSDSRYVTLLSDYNLNSDGSYNTTCGSDINSTYTCSTMAFDADNTLNYDEADSNNIGYLLKEFYSPLVTKKLLETTNVTIPTVEQITSADNKSFDESILSLTSPWLLTTNYWTKTANNGIVWIVYGQNSYLGSSYANTSNYYGARPVITTLKTNLLVK